MAVYTIIKTRSSHRDSRYDEFSHSDFDVICTSDRQIAVSYIADEMENGLALKEIKLNSYSDEYNSTEIIVMINGKHPEYHQDKDSYPTDEEESERQSIYAEGENIAKAAIVHRLAEENRKEEERKKIEQLDREECEKALLNKLKAKYGE